MEEKRNAVRYNEHQRTSVTHVETGPALDTPSPPRRPPREGPQYSVFAATRQHTHGAKTMHQPDPVWSYLRDLTGNQLKLVLCIYRRENLDLPRRVNDIANDANIDRTTVMRNLKELCDKDIIVHTLTARGRQIASLAVDILERSPAMSVMSPDELAWSQNATGAAGLTGQNATENGRIATESRSHNATFPPPPNVRTNQQSQNGSAWSTPLERKAKDLASRSAHILDDMHSLGMHILFWNLALKNDYEAGNHICEGALLENLERLRRRGAENPQPGHALGKAWTKSCKLMFASWGINLNTKPAGVEQPKNPTAAKEWKPR